MVTPPTTKVNTSGEEQVEEISPNTLEAKCQNSLKRLASLNQGPLTREGVLQEKKETKGKKVVSSLDFQEEIRDKQGKAPILMTNSKKSKNKFYIKEEASLAEVNKIGILQKERRLSKYIMENALLAKELQKKKS
ncbi:hypothetical protein Tco_0226373 [Tanacetum coccineum]